MKSADWGFLLGCIPFRIVLAYAAYHLIDRNQGNQGNQRWLRRILMAFTFLVGTGFLVYYARGTAGLGATPDNVWWDSYRPLHAINYLMFTACAYYRIPNASAFLVWDILLGLFLYGQHKCRQ